MVIMYFIKKYTPPENRFEDQLVCDRTDKTTPVLTRKIKYILIALLSLSMTTFAGMEMAFLSYSSAYYQIIPIRFSAQKAAELNSVMSATHTLGKLISAFISIKLKPNIIVAYSFVIIFVSLTIIYMGVNTSWAIWTGNALIGFGYAGVLSSYFSMADNYVRLTNRVSSVLQAASAICPMISPFIYGPLIEKSPQIFILLQFAYLSVAIISFIMIILIARKYIKSDKTIIKCYVNINECK